MSNAIAMSFVAQPTSSVVVQNDEISLTPLVTAQPLTKVLADLETERETWEQGAYRTSNLALYAVLAKCLAIAHHLKHHTFGRRALRVKGFELNYDVRRFS
jgi:hypothetical protein